MSDVLDKAKSLKLDLELVADELDKHFKNVRIARVVGSSVGAGCSLVTIGSGIAIPFTFGASIIPLVVSLVFAGVASAGSLTAGGATIAGSVIEKLKLNEMDTKWEHFRNEFGEKYQLSSRGKVDRIAQIKKVFQELLTGGKQVGEQVGKQVKSIIGIIKTFKTAGQAAKTATAGVTNVAETAASTGVVGASTASSSSAGAATGAAAAAAKTATTAVKSASTGARLAAAASSPVVIVNAVLLGLSIYDIVTASIDLHKNNKSKAGAVLRRMADELDAIITDGVLTQDQVNQCLSVAG